MFYFWPLFVPNRSVMWRSMEALEPGQAGPRVVIMMGAARARVCVGHEPAITPPLSVVASSAMGSAWRLPTAQGKPVIHQHTSVNLSSVFISGLWSYICMFRWRDKVLKGFKGKFVCNFLHPHSYSLEIHAQWIILCKCQLFGANKCWLGVVFFTTSADILLILTLSKLKLTELLMLCISLLLA